MDRARDGRLFCDAAALRSRVRKRLAATLPDATTMSHDSMLGDVVHGAFVCILVPVKVCSYALWISAAALTVWPRPQRPGGGASEQQGFAPDAGSEPADATRVSPASPSGRLGPRKAVTCPTWSGR